MPAIEGTRFTTSASLLKIAAVYAAFELRAAARRLAAQPQVTSSQALFNELSTQVNPEIKSNLPFSLLKDSRVNDSHLLPTFDKVLSATAIAGGSR